MINGVEAVYEHGVLRPLEPLGLEEHQHVRLIVEEVTNDPADAWIDHEYHAAIAASIEPEPTLEEVRHALSGIEGSLSDAIRLERDERG
ncbi:MAG: antitoxin family protein [Candidatus Solibacter usitatus]|nr:antitoxin family protein [Candidatus Solibacter usitatus]